jgi:3-hydroxybutyryl-CoA dehydrogenase
MPFDPKANDVTVAVIGTGTMGRGIMQVSAQGGMHVLAYDEKPGAAGAAKDYIAKMLAAQVDKGRLDAAAAKATLARISIAPDLAAVAKANLVVEAIIENLAIKQDLFAKLDQVCGPDTILATNTSSLLVTAVAAKCTRHPERVGCMHFFNPVPLMKLVEVVPGLKTQTWVTDAMMELGRRMTREPVLCKDSPGFIVNLAGRGIREVERILLENIASVHDMDRILTGAPGLKLGPFALFDMVGIDISHGVHESFYQQYYAEPAFAPSPLGRRFAWRQIWRRLVQACRWQTRRSSHPSDSQGATDIRLGPPQRQPRRLAGPAARSVPQERRHCRDRQRTQPISPDRHHADWL